ncbi:MAG TPA: ATP-binding cassette domain-containing protein [Bryobacteraceae bacterium]|jgi:phospholipid/cholesterol/gamma-HCH transport system ATP-binding protein
MENNQNAEPVLVERLHKSFGEQTVLNDISFSVARGEILSVLGRSGTGKSVLLRLLIGLEKPDAGSIEMNGVEITKLKTEKLNEVRRNIGFLFQQAALYDSLTIEENVQFPLLHNNMPRNGKQRGAERRDRARELLASVGLDKDLNKMPSRISGGMKKRAALARALALDPSIVLFDEPTAGLDPITSAEIGQLIVDLRQQRGMTSIVVTHDLHAAKHFSDRLVLLSEGKIVVDGTFEDLQNSTDEFAKRFLSDSV